MVAVLRGGVAFAFAVVTVLSAACTSTGHDHGARAAATPSPSVSKAPSVPRPSLAPITQQELADAALDQRSWCPQGAILVKSAAVDLDRDGSMDAVAIFVCETPPQAGVPVTTTDEVELAVGFRRTADGSIHSMGTVAGDVYEIPDLRPGSDGTVDLQAAPIEDPDLPALLQWRTYRWTGDRFVQTAGPTSFMVSRPELSATVSDLVFGPAAGGTRTGTLTVSLRNNGTVPVPDATLAYVFAFAQQVTPDCGRWSIDGPPAGLCPLPSIAPGATGTLTLTVIAPVEGVAPYRGLSLGQTGTYLQLRVGDTMLTNQPDLTVPVLR